MFKLVVIGGKYRGKEFALNDGDNIFGRDMECDFQLEEDGVSKRHFNINVHNVTAFIEDLGSSNGTFVNSQITQKKTLEAGDKIAVPNMILQLVHIKEKKIIIKKKVPKMAEVDTNDEDFDDDKEPMPATLVGKIIWAFKHKLMPVLYGFNKEYEWRYMIGIITAIFITTIIALTIFPVIRTSRLYLLSEIVKRGSHYAEEISRLNSRALESNKLDSIDTKFLETEEGVYSYELFDLDGRIYRPIGKINNYISDPFSVSAFNYFKANPKFDVFNKRLDDGQIGISKKITAYNPKRDAIETVGYISIRFAPASLANEAAVNSGAFLEAWSTSALLAILFFGFIYYLTIKPISEIRKQIEEVQRGRRKEVEVPYLFQELGPLKASINSILARLRELSSEDGDSSFDELEDDSTYVKILEELLKGQEGGAIVLDSQKVIQHMNAQVEDIVGFRESSSQGSAIDEVARDQGLAATLLGLCDGTANSGGETQSELYEISGNPYNIHVTALIGKDSFAKAYFITFVRDD